MARSSSATTGAGRRPALLAAKLRLLVTAGWGPATSDDDPSPFPGGAALRRREAAWVLVEDGPARALGPALTWAVARGVGQLHVLVPQAAGLVARRATLFAEPPVVWRIEGGSVVRAEPDPPATAPALAPEVEAFLPMLVAAGVEVVIEHGAVAAEVLGLEVARVVVAEGSRARLEVGVGSHDRECQRQLHGDQPSEAVLAAAVAAVRRRRRPGVPSHAVNQLARERWLRSVLVGRPEMVGAARLAPAPSTSPRGDLRRPTPAVAVGVDLDGRPLVVVCSVGIDLDLVPAAADARLSFDPSARLVLVLPVTDAHAVTRGLASALADPAEIVTVDEGWEEAAPVSRP